MSVARVSRGGTRCHCRESGGYRCSTIGRLILMSDFPRTRHRSTLAELLWIKQSIISVRAEICACKGSRLTFILHRLYLERMLCYSLDYPQLSLSLLLPRLLLRALSILVVFTNRMSFHFLTSQTYRKSSYLRQEVK